MIARIGIFASSLLLAFIVFAGSTIDASAQSCRSLQRQLNAASTGGGSANYRRYDRAVKDQTRQIRRTQRAGRSSGCNSFSRNSNRCRRINSTLDKMQANLNKLKRKRDGFSRGGSGKRKAIEAAMRRNGCFEGERKTRKAKKSGNTLFGNLFKSRKQRELERQERLAALESRDSERRAGVKVLERKRRSTLVEHLFGVRTYSDDSRDGDQLREIERSAPSVNYNTFRTMCVRVSDGYYFPISFSTTKDRFPADEQVCQQLCPGAEAELYFHGMPSQSAEDMVSFKSGKAYASQAFAFSYRKAYDPKNSCNFTAATGGGFQEVAGGTPAQKEVKTRQITKSARKRIGTPVFRPDLASDPEYSVNKEGSLTANAMEALAGRNSNKKKIGAVATTRDGSEIRAVGPKFFPVQ